MAIETFLLRLKNGEPVAFQDTLDMISENYCYTPTGFRNGLGDDCVVNAAGKNEGSCKLFFFACLHGLTPEQTLALFGDYYRKDVLGNPEGTDHANIRTFLKYGWQGIEFEGEALSRLQV